MRSINRTDNGGQTNVRDLSKKPATGSTVTKQALGRTTFGRNVGRAANVQVIDKSPGRKDGPTHTLLPSKFLSSTSLPSRTDGPVRVLDSKPAVANSCLTALSSNHSTHASEDIACGATASASGETKSATRPPVAETLKTLGVSVVSVKADTKQRCVTLRYEGKNVTLRQQVDKDGRFPRSVGVAGGADHKKLLDELDKHKLTFLDLVMKLKPEDAPESGGFFSIFTGLWS